MIDTASHITCVGTVTIVDLQKYFCKIHGRTICEKFALENFGTKQ